MISWSITRSRQLPLVQPVPYEPLKVPKLETVQQIHASFKTPLTEEQQKIQRAYVKRQYSVPKRLTFATDLMSKNLQTISEHLTLSDARLFFKMYRFRHLPVVNKEKELRGIISDRDILSCLADDMDLETPISSFMIKKILTATTDTNLHDIAKVLFEEHIGSILICNKPLIVEGIITRSDILRSLIKRAPLELWL